MSSPGQRKKGSVLPSTIIKGRYQILGPFRETRGAFLFKGRLLDGNKAVIIKLLKVKTATNRPLMERYRGELEMTARLPAHENLLKIHDFDYVGERFFVVSDFFPSLSAEELLARRQALPLALVLRMLEQLAVLLGFAHREGCVYRHVKMDDILVSPSEYRLKVSRFSMPRSVFSSPGVRRPSFGAATDILSLGVLLYRLFCFDYPFAHRNEPPELAADRLEDRLKTTYAELPPSDVKTISSLFVHCTTRDIERRLDRYEDFIEVIRGLCDRCKTIVEERRRKEAEEKRKRLETAFDTVAALRGDFVDDSRQPGLRLSKDERVLLEGRDEDGTGDEGRLVWSRLGEGIPSLDSPMVTMLLTGTIALVLLVFVVKLFF